jgi:hypothetical protein
VSEKASPKKAAEDKARRERYAALGLCRLGKSHGPPVSGKLCQACRDRATENQRIRKARRNELLRAILNEHENRRRDARLARIPQRPIPLPTIHAKRRLITELTFKGEDRISRAMREAREVTPWKGGEREHFDRRVSKEFHRRLALYGIAVETNAGVLHPPIELLPRRRSA